MSTHYSDMARMPGTAPTWYPGIQLETPPARGETPIADLPEDLLRSIFEIVGAGNQESVCKQFLVSNLKVRFQQGIDLLRLNAATKNLSRFGIGCPATIETPNDAIELIKAANARILALNTSLPEDMKFSGRIADLVLDAPRLQEFLQRAYKQQLCIALGDKAHVPSGTDLNESVKRIHEWLKSFEAQDMERLDLRDRKLFCLPREVFLLEGLHDLTLNHDTLAAYPPEGIALLDMNRSTQMLSTFGIQCPENITSAGQAFNLIRKTIDRIDLINTRLPKALRFQGRIADLVLDAPRLQEFLQRAYDHQLCIALREKAHVPAGTPLPEAVATIKSWLTTDEAKAVTGLMLESTDLFCLPKEVCQLTGLQKLVLTDNFLRCIPDEIGNLANLRILDLYSNQLKSIPASIANLRDDVFISLDDSLIEMLPYALALMKRLNFYGQ